MSGWLGFMADQPLMPNPVYIYIYIYMCVCVCVCVWLSSNLSFKYVSLNNKNTFVYIILLGSFQVSCQVFGFWVEVNRWIYRYCREHIRTFHRPSSAVVCKYEDCFCLKEFQIFYNIEKNT